MTEYIIELVTKLFLAVLAIIIPTIVAMVGNKLSKYYSVKAAYEKNTLLKTTVTGIVRAVAQQYQNADKEYLRTQATERIQSFVDSKGIKLDVVAIRNLLEEAVADYKLYYAQNAPLSQCIGVEEEPTNE